LVDSFLYGENATVLMHPIATTGTELILEYLTLVGFGIGSVLLILFMISWRIRKYKLKFLEPRVDFFEKHPSQYKKKSNLMNNFLWNCHNKRKYNIISRQKIMSKKHSLIKGRQS
jgi:hypothetical protein